jgi:predicted metalloprotease
MRAVTACTILLVALAGCGGEEGPRKRDSPPPKPPTAAELIKDIKLDAEDAKDPTDYRDLPSGEKPELTGDMPAPQDDSFEEYRTYIGGVEGLIERYWRETLPKAFDVELERIPAVYAYYPTNSDTWPTCPASGNRLRSRGNAFHCPSGFFIAFDEPTLMFRDYLAIGDAAPALILAHEWGHAIQTVLRLDFRSSFAREVQADCFAGAWIKWMDEHGWVEDGDSDELAAEIYGLRDERPERFEASNGHGNFKERVGAFRQGTKKGAKSCTS